MTKIQELLGKILKNRITEELRKESKDFTSIQETMDIFLAGNKITSEQYGEFTELMISTTEATKE